MNFEIDYFLHLDQLTLLELRNNLGVGVGLCFLDNQELLLGDVFD